MLHSTHLLELLQKLAVLHPCQQNTSADVQAPGADDSTATHPPENENKTEQSFRNVQELRAAGINLKLSKNHCSLKNITLKSICFSGSLELPPLIFDDSTGPKFLNLIAYEMCPDNFRTKFEVTSYICFMDSLIDHANDVKELRSAKILRNHLGSDEEVAKLFNEIATDLPDPEMYKGVKDEIQNHCKKKCMTWMAEACTTHFSSPWTILAFVGALLALVMSGLQTWYTINPVAD